MEFADTEGFEDAGDVEKSIDELCASLGGDDSQNLKIHIYKDSNFNGKTIYPKIWVGPPDEFDVDALVNEHGSGHYKVRVYGRDAEKGTNGIKLNTQFHWLESQKRKREREKQLEQKTETQLSPDMLARTIADAVRAAIPPAPPAPQVDPMAMIAQVFTMVKAITPETKTNALSEVKELLALTRELREVGNPEPPSGMETLSKVATQFAPMINAAMSPASGGEAVASPSLPAPQPDDEAAEMENDEMEMRVRLQAMLDLMCNMADKNVSTDLALSLLPPDLTESPDVISLVKSQKADVVVTMLGGVCPDILEHRAWFEELVLKMRDSIAA